MRKILSLFGAIILSTTATTGLMACGGKLEANQPTNFSDLLDNVIVNEVSEFIKDDFIIKLVNVLKNQKGFDKLSKDDFNITKANGDILTDNDIVDNDNLEITVSAKQDNRFFKGTKNITVKLTIAIQTDLSGLPDSANVSDVIAGNIESFIKELIYAIDNEREFQALWIDDIVVYKKDTSILLSDNDIVDNDNLEITVSAKQDNRFFKGTKNIKVKLTIAIQTDLSGLPDSANVSDVIAGNIGNFIDKLIYKINAEQKFKNKNLTENDVDITKSDGSSLQDSDIVNNDDLEIKVSAKQSSLNFIGTKNITVNLTTI